MSKSFRPTSSSPSGSHRFGSQGLLAETRKNRMASAPCSSTASQGSTVFPLDLDIFWPSASRIRSFTTTAR